MPESNRIVVVALGSRGDVEPYLALATALVRAGHDVALVGSAEFAGLAAEDGVRFVAGGRSIRAALDAVDGTGGIAGRNPLILVQRLREVLRDVMIESLDATVEACAGARLVIASTLAVHAATAAEIAGVPRVVDAHLQPVATTREFPAVTWPSPRPLGDLANLATHRLGNLGFRAIVTPAVSAIRDRHGLPRRQPKRPSGWPTLYGFSPAVIPVPRDWPASERVTGYWWPSLPPDWTPPAELDQFLRSGDKPVYIGFGSMPGPEPSEPLGEQLLAAVRVARLRAVVLAGSSGLGRADTTDEVFVTEPVPHEWLLPQTRVAVHHCGAGTTAAALRAGVPSVPVPHLGDQAFWAGRLRRLGAATQPVRRRNLDPRRLAAAMNAATRDEHLLQAARGLARVLQAEDGTANAVRALAPLLP